MGEVKESTTKPWREVRELSELPARPGHAGSFGDLPPRELEALAEDIRVNGLEHPIEVLPANAAGLPPNTVICGHQRWRALALLKETSTRVRVRHALAD